MLLAVDIGNTNITLGVYECEKLCFTSRLATDRKRMEDQYAVEIRDILALYDVECSQISGAIVSSVVPPLTRSIVRAVARLCPVEPLVLGENTRTDLCIKLDDPSQTGADLIAVSVAAKALYPLPNVVCDLGTASTITVLDKDGNMLGGIIYPGMRTSLDALVANTAQLPLVSFEAPERIVGRGTVEAMQSGLVYGAAALLDGMLERVEEELGMPVTAIATGGLAELVIPHCKKKLEYSDNLVLEGLRMIYQMNTK